MDPYLEGPEWPDFHNSLAYVIKKILVPQISPGYSVRLEKYIALDTEPAQGLGIIYPDVEVWQKPPEMLSEPAAAYTALPVLTPPTITVPFPEAVKVSIPVIEIRDSDKNRLITSIEVLSPVNKRLPGFEKHRKKQRRLHERGVHLIEIDLLRQGQRLVHHPVAIAAHYLVALLRGHKPQADIWAINIRDTLPVIPVPLKSPDRDATLDLQKAFNDVYAESFYRDSLNYSKEPPLPLFSAEDQEWIRRLLR